LNESVDDISISSSDPQDIVRSSTSSTASDPQHSRPLETQAFLSGENKTKQKTKQNRKVEKKESIKTPSSDKWFFLRWGSNENLNKIETQK